MTDFVELPADALLDHEQGRGVYGSGGVEDANGSLPVAGGKPANMTDIPAGATDVEYDPATGEVIGYRDPTTGRVTVNVRPDSGFAPLPADAQLDAPKVEAPTTLLGNIGLGVRDTLAGGGQLLNFIQTPTAAIWNALGGHSADYEKLADQLSDKLGLPQVPEDGHLGSAFRRGLAMGALTAGVGSGAAGLEGATGAAGRALAESPIATTIGSGTSEASSEGAREAGFGPVGQTVAGIAGGLVAAPIAAAPTAGRAGVQAVKSAISPFTEQGALDRAASVLNRSLSGSRGNAIDNIESAAPFVEGVQPTLGEIAGDTGLAGLQRGHANSNPNAGAALFERNAQNAIARRDFVDQQFGDGQAQAVQDLGAGQIRQAEKATATQQQERATAADQKLVEAREKAAKALAEARDAHAQVIANLGATADREATGATARTAFEDAYDAAKQRTREAYANPALNKPQPLANDGNFFPQIEKSLDAFYGDGGGYVPEQLRQIIDDASAQGATTRTLTNIDRRLADYAGSARMAGNRSDAAFAENLRGQLSDFAQKNAPPEYREALKSAKAIRADQGRIFETGDVANAFGRDKFGNPTTGDTTIPTRIARPGAAGGDTADRLIAAIGPERAEGLVRQEIRRVAEDTGISTEAQADSLATRYGDMARRFPAVQRDLDAIRLSAARMDAARSASRAADSASLTAADRAAINEKSALQTAIENTPIAQVANAGTDPTSFIGSLLGRDDNGRRLQTLWKQVGQDKDAQAGFRRALGDYVIRKGTGNGVTAAGDELPSALKTRQAIKTVVTRAGDALTREQKIALTRISTELKAAHFANSAGRPLGSDTAMNLAMRKLTQNIPGRAGEVVGKVLQTMENTGRVQEFITKAILDPQFAATLLKRPTPQHIQQIVDGLGSRVVGSSTLASAPVTHPSLTPVAQYLGAPPLAAQQQPQQQAGQGN